MSDARLAVVTGASQGIGAACVSALKAGGYRVLGVDVSSESGADEHLVVDLASPSCGDPVAEAVGSRPLAALINNAAVGANELVEETSVELWDSVIDTNLRAPFLVSKALAPALRRGGGSIVNVASVHAQATSVRVAAYAASKGGLAALTRAMAVEWAPYGIRVNCVLPGAIATPMLEEGLARTDATIESLGAKHPVGRIGDPEEVAAAIVFLLDGGAGFVTGASLVVDGGALARLSTE
jgi:NAD(P)-dependent dehydrogenase (short-subunit alcohol dehydrogenase family)